MGWLRIVGSLQLQVSVGEYSLFYRALLQKRHIILRSLLIVATPYESIGGAKKAKNSFLIKHICIIVSKEAYMIGLFCRIYSSLSQDICIVSREPCMRHSATHCNTLQHAATHRNRTDFSMMSLSVRRNIVATHCNTLQHTTAHCNTLQHTAKKIHHTAPHCTTLHYTSTHCTTPQLTATHCNTLQHTATH